MMKFYILIDGEVREASLQGWAVWFDENDRRIERTEVGEVTISTAFVGLPHNIFETMIFGGPHDGYQRRYNSLEEAKTGHLEAVAMCQ